MDTHLQRSEQRRTKHDLLTQSIGGGDQDNERKNWQRLDDHSTAGIVDKPPEGDPREECCESDDGPEFFPRDRIPHPQPSYRGCIYIEISPAKKEFNPDLKDDEKSGSAEESSVTDQEMIKRILSVGF